MADKTVSIPLIIVVFFKAFSSNNTIRYEGEGIGHSEVAGGPELAYDWDAGDGDAATVGGGWGEFAAVGLLKKASGMKASQAAAVEMLSTKMPASLARKEEKVEQPNAS